MIAVIAVAPLTGEARPAAAKFSISSGALPAAAKHCRAAGKRKSVKHELWEADKPVKVMLKDLMEEEHE